MNFKLGDFVRFVDERREGYITRIIDEQMVGVTGDDDFEIPVPASKITRVHGHNYEDNQGIVSFQDTKADSGEFQSKGVYLAFITDQRSNSVVNFHMINETSFQLLISLTSERSDKYKGEYAGIVQPKTATKIYTASLTELNNWPKFIVQALFYSPQNIKPLAPLLFEDKFKAKDFSTTKKKIPLLNENGWVVRLDEEELVIDAEKLKESFFKPAEERKTIDIPSKEIDLHIEKLRDDYQFLSKNEILKIQLEQFKKTLEAAIVHKLHNIIVIHGVGNGTLRYEIHKTLSKHPQVKTFMDARKERFGYGATEVIFK